MHTLTQAKDLVKNQGYAIKNDDTVDKLREVIKLVFSKDEDIPYGRKHTQETKDKMAILSSQRIKIIGVSQKFINAQKGKIRTEIHKQKISESISGDKHHSKKLNKEQVFEIISSKEKPTALARKFNVTYRTIYNIQKRKNWKIID